jgi:hypothetical protein
MEIADNNDAHDAPKRAIILTGTAARVKVGFYEEFNLDRERGPAAQTKTPPFAAGSSREE